MKDICWLRIEEGGVENVDFMSACADMFTSLYVFSTGYASRCFLLLCSCTNCSSTSTQTAGEESSSLLVLKLSLQPYLGRIGKVKEF